MIFLMIYLGIIIALLVAFIVFLPDLLIMLTNLNKHIRSFVYENRGFVDYFFYPVYALYQGIVAVLLRNPPVSVDLIITFYTLVLFVTMGLERTVFKSRVTSGDKKIRDLYNNFFTTEKDLRGSLNREQKLQSLVIERDKKIEEYETLLKKKSLNTQNKK